LPARHDPAEHVVVVSELGDPAPRRPHVPWLTVMTPGHVSVYQLMQVRQVVFERSALLALEEALAR